MLFTGWIRSCLTFSIVPLLTYGFLGFFEGLITGQMSSLNAAASGQTVSIGTVAPFVAFARWARCDDADPRDRVGVRRAAPLPASLRSQLRRGLPDGRGGAWSRQGRGGADWRGRAGGERRWRRRDARVARLQQLRHVRRRQRHERRFGRRGAGRGGTQGRPQIGRQSQGSEKLTFEPDAGVAGELRTTRHEKPRDNSHENSQAKPAVDARYYDEALSWDASHNLSIRMSRNAWRVIAVVMGLALVVALGALWALIPLKSVEVVTLLVDKTTGFVEVAQPLERGGELSQRESSFAPMSFALFAPAKPMTPRACATISIWRRCFRPARRRRIWRAISRRAIHKIS